MNKMHSYSSVWATCSETVGLRGVKTCLFFLYVSILLKFLLRCLPQFDPLTYPKTHCEMVSERLLPFSPFPGVKFLHFVCVYMYCLYMWLDVLGGGVGWNARWGRERGTPWFSLSVFHHHTIVCAPDHCIFPSVILSQSPSSPPHPSAPYVSPGQPLYRSACRCRGGFYQAGLSGVHCRQGCLPLWMVWPIGLNFSPYLLGR